MLFGQHEAKMRVCEAGLSYGVIQLVACLVFHFAASPDPALIGAKSVSLTLLLGGCAYAASHQKASDRWSCLELGTGKLAWEAPGVGKGGQVTFAEGLLPYEADRCGRPASRIPASAAVSKRVSKSRPRRVRLWASSPFLRPSVRPTLGPFTITWPLPVVARPGFLPDSLDHDEYGRRLAIWPLWPVHSSSLQLDLGNTEGIAA